MRVEEVRTDEVRAIGHQLRAETVRVGGGIASNCSSSNMLISFYPSLSREIGVLCVPFSVK